MGRGKPVYKNQSPDDWLLHGVELELRRLGLATKGLAYRWKTIAPKYGEQAASIRAELEQHLGPGITNAEKIALGRLAARCLADFLRPAAPVGLRSMLVNIDKVLVALDNSYPDYLRTGMLKFLIHRTGEEPRG